jgi:hypothetical protein
MKKDEDDNTSKIDLEAIMDVLSEKFEKTKEKRWRNKNEDDETALININQPRAVPNYDRGRPQKRTNTKKTEDLLFIMLLCRA